MLKKEMTYKNYDGTEDITETFYFNLSKPDLLELEVSYKDGIEGTLKDFLAKDDKAGLLAFFKKVILLSHGVKSEDGKRFNNKDEKATEEFTQTNAYSDLYMELLNNSDAAAAFVSGIVPSDLAEAMKEETVKQKTAELLGTKAPDANL